MSLFSIGRGPSNFFVVEDDSVSKNHAQIEINGADIILKDLNSTNGTFVNGLQIFQKTITEKDILKIGGYFVDTTLLFERIRAFENTQKTDFSKEFNNLGEIYKRFKREMNDVDKKQNIKKIVLRIIITLLLIGICFIIFGNTTLTLIIGIVSGGLVSFFINDGDVKERKDEIRLKFQDEYKCPKCEADLTKHGWTYWKNRGKCPSASCNATWYN